MEHSSTWINIITHTVDISILLATHKISFFFPENDILSIQSNITPTKSKHAFDNQ